MLVTHQPAADSASGFRGAAERREPDHLNGHQFRPYGVAGQLGRRAQGPHWLIDENNGTTRAAALMDLLDRHRCGDRGVTESALSPAAAPDPVLIFATARSTTRRLTLASPHSSSLRGSTRNLVL